MSPVQHKALADGKGNGWKDADSMGRGVVTRRLEQIMCKYVPQVLNSLRSLKRSFVSTIRPSSSWLLTLFVDVAASTHLDTAYLKLKSTLVFCFEGVFQCSKSPDCLNRLYSMLPCPSSTTSPAMSGKSFLRLRK